MILVAAAPTARSRTRCSVRPTEWGEGISCSFVGLFGNCLPHSLFRLARIRAERRWTGAEILECVLNSGGMRGSCLDPRVAAGEPRFRVFREGGTAVASNNKNVPNSEPEAVTDALTDVDAEAVLGNIALQ
jgi:hypothetical protein